MLKLMVGVTPVVSLVVVIAWRSVPAPLSFVLTTVISRLPGLLTVIDGLAMLPVIASVPPLTVVAPV